MQPRGNHVIVLNLVLGSQVLHDDRKLGELDIPECATLNAVVTQGSLLQAVRYSRRARLGKANIGC